MVEAEAAKTHHGHAMLRSVTDDDDDCGSAVLASSAETTPRLQQPRKFESLPSVISSDVSDTESEEEPLVVDDWSSRDDSVASVPLREPLRFSFVGYTVWLHLSQDALDLDRALQSAAERHGVLPIPAPHVTVVYGMTHLSEDEVRAKFLDETPQRGVKGRVKQWPKLRTKGLLFDRCYDGVDGDSMDMAWMEITLATSPAHETLVDAVHDIFHDEPPAPSSAGGMEVDEPNASDGHSNGDQANSSQAAAAMPPRRPRPWTPHLSLAYDNPDDGSPLSLGSAAGLTADIPSLLLEAERDVTAISLWKTEGRMEEWIELERIELLEQA